MKKNRTFLLIILFGVTSVYSIVSLFTTEQKFTFVSDFSPPIKQRINNTELAQAHSDISNRDFTSQQNKLSTKQYLSSKEATTAQQPLPIAFSLVGVRLRRDRTEESIILLQYQDDLHEYSSNQYILNSDILLTAIQSDMIELSYQAQTYKIQLMPPNLLADSYKDAQQTYAQMLAMNESEIGSRPRIIEHIATLTPTAFIADGKLLSPGLNPLLFDKIGFRQDDVIKTINGKSVTLEAEFEAIKREIYTATTLEFLVMRKGRLITLYLDIPSETLELSRD